MDQQLLIYEHLARDVAADFIVLCVSVENIERIKVVFRETIERTTRQHFLVSKPYVVFEDGKLLPTHVPVSLTRPRPEELDTPTETPEEEVPQSVYVMFWQSQGVGLQEAKEKDL